MRNIFIERKIKSVSLTKRIIGNVNIRKWAVIEAISDQLIVKGQLISKGLFGILNSSKKRTKKFDLTTMTPQVDLFSFVYRRI